MLIVLAILILIILMILAILEYPAVANWEEVDPSHTSRIVTAYLLAYIFLFS